MSPIILTPREALELVKVLSQVLNNEDEFDGNSHLFDLLRKLERGVLGELVVPLADRKGCSGCSSCCHTSDEEEDVNCADDDEDDLYDGSDDEEDEEEDCDETDGDDSEDEDDEESEEDEKKQSLYSLDAVELDALPKIKAYHPDTESNVKVEFTYYDGKVQFVMVNLDSGNEVVVDEVSRVLRTGTSLTVEDSSLKGTYVEVKRFPPTWTQSIDIVGEYIDVDCE
jgi:hypothetical protein